MSRLNNKCVLLTKRIKASREKLKGRNREKEGAIERERRSKCGWIHRIHFVSHKKLSLLFESVQQGKLGNVAVLYNTLTGAALMSTTN